MPQSAFATMKVPNVLGQKLTRIFEGNAEAGTFVWLYVLWSESHRLTTQPVERCNR
jgi:hypothetical protein